MSETTDLIRAVRDGLGLRNARMAELLGLSSERKVYAYLSEERTPNGQVLLRALQLAHRHEPDLVPPLLEAATQSLPQLPLRPMRLPSGGWYEPLQLQLDPPLTAAVGAGALMLPSREVA